jgi:outer membrane protein assembly factor BamB
MKDSPAMNRLSALALLALLLLAAPAPAAITKLTPLAEVLESDQFIFVAKAEKLDPDNKDRPTAVFTVTKKLKGEPTFDRVPMNMTGDDEGKKGGDTKTAFARLDTSREVIFFLRKQGKLYNAKLFVEGSWFSAYGQIDADGKTVRWAFLHGEPFLRRTFKGTSAEMVKTVEDALAKKAKPPEPDEKEKPGYGPVVAAKKCDECEASSPALFAVIPSFVLAGPLAIIAALFPGVFARMAVGMKRWRAFLVVASLNSTLALLYWVVLTYRAHWLAVSPWLSPTRFTMYLTVIALVGLLWAGRRYRRLAAEDTTVTRTPGKGELYTLLGLTAFAAVATVLTAVFANWSSTVELPMREFTFIGIALLTATAYAAYRVVTRHIDEPASELQHPVRLSVSGESVGLSVLVLCGLFTVLLASGRAPGPGVSEVKSGDAEANFGPRQLGQPVAIVATDDDEKKFGRVMSNLALDGDRLVFGADIGGNNGSLFCMNRHTGKLDWQLVAAGEPPNFLKAVYCTPTIAGGKVYCGEGMHENKGCRLFCVNLATGALAWDPPFKTKDGHTEGMPAVVGDKVYFPAGDDGLICADAKTGKQVWQYTGNGKDDVHIDAPPVVSNGLVFAGSGLFNYVAVALDAATGKEQWRTDLKMRVFGAPTVVGNKVFYAVGTGNMGADVFKYDEEGAMREKNPAGAVYCLDAATGKEEWRYPLPKAVHTGIAVDPFSAYVGCRDGNVYALDRRTGKLRWQIGIGGAVLSCPTVVQSGGFPVAVYAVSQEGMVVCLNPQTGAVAWQSQLPGYQYDGRAANAVMCSPLVVTTPTATGSKRTIYIGGMTLDPANENNKRVAVFKFEDVIGE